MVVGMYDVIIWYGAEQVYSMMMASGKGRLGVRLPRWEAGDRRLIDARRGYHTRCDILS